MTKWRKKILIFIHPLFLSLEAHKHVLDAAKARLLARIDDASPGALLALLGASFPFIGLPALRDVPLAALARLHPVPAAFLKQLAADRDLFADLPPSVQRQVWELDRALLHAHAAPAVDAYCAEAGTRLRCLDGAELVTFTSDASSSSTAPRPRAPRRVQRAGSPSLRRLVAMVGRSPAVYRGVCDLIAARARDAGGLVLAPRDAALAALRSQLLMALHDGGGGGTGDLASGDPVHKLAWTLDAALRDGALSDRRLADVAAAVAPLDAAPATAPAQARGRARGGGAPPRKRDRADRGDAESAGAPGGGGGAASRDARARAIGDAALVVRDPSTLRLLAHAAAARVAALTATATPPGGDAQLALLARLLGLATGVRAVLREPVATLPPPPADLVRVLFPTLAGTMLESIVCADDPPPPPSTPLPPADASLVALLVRDEAARAVTQAAALDAVAARDARGAAPLLAALGAALAKASDDSVPEWTPFAVGLAQTLARAGGVAVGGEAADAAAATTAARVAAFAPGTPLWTAAVDTILLRCADADPQAHEELLRLLLAGARSLDRAHVAAVATAALVATRRSRRAAARRRPPPPGRLPAAPSSASLGTGYSSGGGLGGGGGTTSAASAGGGFSSAGRPGARRGGRGDSVRFLYSELARVSGLEPDDAPELHQYLGAGPPTAVGGGGGGQGGV